ncbi:MAG: EAL domain-containing protein [Thiohalophilus sp.]
MPQPSLQKRFFAMALVILAVLGGVVYYSHTLVNQAAGEAIQTIAETRELEQRVNELRSRLQTLMQLVYQRTVISYSQDDHINQKLLEQVEVVDNQIDSFFSKSGQYSSWREESKEEPASFAALAADVKQHFQKIKRYINYYNMVLEDPRLRFPSAGPLNDELLPLNRSFISSLNNAINEMENTESSDQKETALGILTDLRYSWIQQISVFRMFALSRSGMFDTPKTAMRTTLFDRELFVARVSSLLSRLDRLDGLGVLPFETSASVEQMIEIQKQYEKRFNEIKPMLMSDEWRIDHLFLQENLQPEFQVLSDLINRISESIKQHSTNVITQTRDVVGNINVLIMLSGAVLLGVMVLGYLAFERLIRRPVLVVADAMNAEANGESFYPIISANIKETRLLVEAFHNMQGQVHSRQTRLESILGSAAEGIISMDENGVIEAFNKAAEELFGYRASEILGENINQLFPAEIQARQDSLVAGLCQGKIRKTDSEVETVGLHRDGFTFPMSLKISEMTVGGRSLYTALVDDVSERMTMISNLRHLAEHDSLTGLANRYFFLQELERVVQRASRGQHSDVALLYIDMDNFKYVNDTMGHMAGDKLLIEVSGMLKRRSRDTDLVARIGGDEFAVLLYDVTPEDVLHTAEAFRDKLQNHHFSFEGRIADVGCSIGVAMVEQGVSKDELLARADLSCNAAKRAGRNKVHLYSDIDKQNLENISDDMGWVRRIKDAVRDDRFVFVLQPIIHSVTHEVSRCEVLLRMLDDNDKFIMPSGFISPAERFGMMPEIDRWVINHAVDFLASEESDDMKLSVNLSAASFDTEEMLTFITDKIAQTGVDPTRLIFEITETVAMANLELTASFMEKLRKLGCRTALDDFGVGYSSFAYLKDLPVDYVKIDGSFVCDIDSNELNRAIVKSMNDVAQAMGKLTVAEFVENEAGMHMLELMGVDYLQGHHIGRPVIPAFETRRIDLARSTVSSSWDPL